MSKLGRAFFVFCTLLLCVMLIAFGVTIVVFARASWGLIIIGVLAAFSGAAGSFASAVFLTPLRPSSRPWRDYSHERGTSA